MLNTKIKLLRWIRVTRSRIDAGALITHVVSNMLIVHVQIFLKAIMLCCFGTVFLKFIAITHITDCYFLSHFNV